ncbi:MAG: 4-azaleucine resistance transporter AzlC, partial [Paracoccaceae bacterium]
WDGLPIAAGYIPIAFSFGVAASKLGLSGTEIFMVSLIIYAGAAQFLMLALLASGASLPLSAIMLVALNLRHVLYGPALLRQANFTSRLRWAWAWAFGLTDEVFAASTAEIAKGKMLFAESYMFGIGIAAYSAWLSGTVAGALAGAEALQFSPMLDAALGFMLPALFLALLLSILGRAQMPVIALSVLMAVLGTLIGSPTVGLLLGMFSGASFGAWRHLARPEVKLET